MGQKGQKKGGACTNLAWPSILGGAGTLLLLVGIAQGERLQLLITSSRALVGSRAATSRACSVGAWTSTPPLCFPPGPGVLFPRAASGRMLQESQLAFKGRHLEGAGGGGGLQLPDTPQFVTAAQGLTITEFCQPSHAHDLAVLFSNKSKEVDGWSACGETKWIDELHSALRKPRCCLECSCRGSMQHHGVLSCSWRGHYVVSVW